jgi:hypothetical protein
MKLHFVATLLFTSLLLASCKKNTNDNLQEPIPVGTVLKTGTLVTGTKTTSGTVKVVQGDNNTIKLVFENLSTGNGPDVRVWLSPNNTANPYQEVGNLKATSGNFSYDLSSSINYTTNNRVLIWCEDVSVLFGYAILQ